MAGLLAAHATAMNATNYTNTYARCVFQKVRRTSCAHKSRNSHHLFKGKPTASRAEAFALCDADPECDAVQQYGDEALIKEERDDWAEACGADICYMKCKDLGKDGCGRTRLVGSGYGGDRRLEVLLDELLDEILEELLYGGFLPFIHVDLSPWYA